MTSLHVNLNSGTLGKIMIPQLHTCAAELNGDNVNGRVRTSLKQLA